MPLRDHGYYGYAFLGARPLQIIALGAIVGMTGHFVSQDAHANIAAPSPVVGTLVVSALGLLWTILSLTAYDDAHVPYYVTAVLDLVFTVPFVVGAAVLGGPLGGFSCSVLPTNQNTDLLAIQTKAATATSPAAYILFVGDNQTTCYQIMAVWGLAIALCALFAVSGLAVCLLFLGKRRSARPVLPTTNIAPPPATRAFSTVPLTPAEPAGIEMASAAPNKWHGSDEDDEYDDDDTSNTYHRGSVHGSLHGSVHGSVHDSFTRASSFYSPEHSPATAPAFPSAHGRSLHPRLSAAAPLAPLTLGSYNHPR